MSLDISISKHGNIPVIEIAGRVVDVDAKKFARKMESFCKDAKSTVVVDVSRLNFINSQGLGVLVYHHTVLQQQQRQLIILNRNPNRNSYVRRLFELTNLEKVIPTCASWENVLACACAQEQGAFPQ